MNFFYLPFNDISAKRIAALFVVAVTALIFQPAEGAVELVYFRGNVSNDQLAVEITWKTSYEQRTAGYFIKRKVKGSPDEAEIIPVLLNNSSTQFIQSAENGITGAEYAVLDPNVTEGITYEYTLWEQEFNNSTPSTPEDLFEISAAFNQYFAAGSLPQPCFRLPEFSTPIRSGIR